MINTLLLMALMIATCIGCNKEPKDDSTEIPETPVFGYIDFAIWHKIMLTDVEYAQPQIKGTMVFDTTLSQGERVLIYRHETEGGAFTTKYGFDHTGVLYYILAKPDSVYQPTQILRHMKAVGEELNKFIEITPRADCLAFNFDIEKNGKSIGGIAHNSINGEMDKYHTTFWRYIDRCIDKGINEGETFAGTQMWQMLDNKEQANTMPYTMSVLQFTHSLNEDYLRVDFARNGYMESEEDQAKRLRLFNFVYLGPWYLK